MITTLETSRLQLRPVALDDADLLAELDSDLEVMRYLTGKPSTREEVLTTIAEHLGCRWIATERGGGVFIGWFGLVPTSDATYEVGYRLVRAWWGLGLATEGAKALIDAAFGSLEARRITAQTMAVNERSRSVMERCGMRLERTFHLQWDDPLPGTEEGEVEYGLSRQAWDARRKREGARTDSRQVTSSTAEEAL